MRPRYANVVFDVDGTLIESSSALSEGFHQLFEERKGRPMTGEEEARAQGLPGMESLAAVGLEPCRRNLDRWLDLTFARYDDVYVYRGIPELLDALGEAGCGLGVVTSEDAGELRRGFARFGLLERFQAVITSDDTLLHKPHGDPLLACLKRGGWEAAQTLYVGDGATDAACARAAGVPFAQAAWKEAGEGSPLPRFARSNRVFSSPESLGDWLLGARAAHTAPMR